MPLRTRGYASIIITVCFIPCVSVMFSLLVQFGDNMEHIYRDLSDQFTNKTFKHMIDYFYR